MSNSIAKKTILMILVFIIAIFSMQIVSNAASFSISSGKTTMTTGDSTTVTIGVVDCVGSFKLTSSDTSVVSISGSSDMYFDDPNNVTYTRKYICYN